MASWASRCSCPCRKGARCLSFPSALRGSSGRSACGGGSTWLGSPPACATTSAWCLGFVVADSSRGHPVEVGGLFVWCTPGLVVRLGGLLAVVHHPVQAVVEVLWQVLGSVQLLQQLVQQFFCPLCCFFSAVYAAPVSSLFAAKEGACALLEHPEGLLEVLDDAGDVYPRASLSLSSSTGHEGCLSLSLPPCLLFSLSLSLSDVPSPTVSPHKGTQWQAGISGAYLQLWAPIRRAPRPSKY